MNKRLFIWSVVLFFIGALTSCSDDSTAAGSGILDETIDGIVVGVDTFAITSQLQEGTHIYTTPDSFLLGECDSKFGTLHADILTQLVSPEGFEYPKGAEVDSVCIFVYYTSWHGDGFSPLTLNIYQMDGETMQFNGVYSCFDPLEKYCSATSRQQSILTRPRTVIAAEPTDSVYNSSKSNYTSYVRFRTTDKFAKDFFEVKQFGDQDTFNEAFKGLYITSQFGGSTMLHVSDVSLAVYYHYEYQQYGDTTTLKETDVKAFYSNSEVRQLNRYEYINPQLSNLISEEDSVNYIVSPGNIFTNLHLPIKKMCDDVQSHIGKKRAYINQAEVKVEVLNYYTGTKEDKTMDDWAQPSTYMLLIRKDEVDNFFSKNKLPNDTSAILQSISQETDSLDNTTYCYKFDLSNLLTHQLRNIEKDSASAELLPDVLEMVLVPVDVTISTTSNGGATFSRVKHKQTMSTTAIKSANNADNPMILEVVYSGF